MAAQLAPVVQLPVYRSTRRVSIFPSLPDNRIEDVGPVMGYSLSWDAKINVHLKDRAIENVDYVLFGTGYYPQVSYLRVFQPPNRTTQHTPRSLAPLTYGTILQPIRIPSLYRHVLYAPNASLAFTGALISFTPFAMADLTSTWLTLVWRAQIAVPSTTEARLVDERARLDTLRQLRAETDNPSELVSFHFLAQFELEYAQMVRTEIVRAAPHLAEVLAPWDEAQDERRFGMYATKLDSLYVLAGRKKG